MRLLHNEKNELLANEWDPHNNPKATGNAFHTLFVGRLSYDTTEKKLRREFEQFGNIKSIRVVEDSQSDKPRGYAFIEFENEQDMTSAYRKSEGKKIDGKRIVVDVERGRTVRNWRPMRFGGGLGGRLTREERLVKDEAFGAPRLEERSRGGDSRERRNPVSRTSDRDGDRDRDRSRERDRGGRDRERDHDTRRSDNRESRRSNSRDRKSFRDGDSRNGERSSYSNQQGSNNRRNSRERDYNRRGSSRDRAGNSRERR